MLHKSIFVFTLSFISGFTIMITGNTLNYWLVKENIDLRTVSIFAFISLPYAINFLWAPIFDTKKIPYLSKWLSLKYSWLVLIHIVLFCNLLFLSFLEPQNNILLFGILGFFISFLTSTQDVVLGGLKVETISSNDQYKFSGVSIFGYRIGMLISNSGAIYLSEYIDFGLIYRLFALMILIFSIILTLYYERFYSYYIEYKSSDIVNKKIDNKALNFSMISILNKVLTPLGSFHFQLLVILFVILYRLPDYLINIMMNPFLISLSLSGSAVAGVGKLFSTICVIIGSLLASMIMIRYSVYKSLLLFGILHGIGHSFFILQNYYYDNLLLLAIIIAIDSITSGMSLAGYFAFISSLCKGDFRGTQYSFFTSIMGLCRSIFPSLSGYLVNQYGWTFFFLVTTFAALPSLIVILMIMRIKAKII